MKVLGVTPSSNDVLWALAEGKRTEPILIPQDTTKQKFPKGQAEEKTLLDLLAFVRTLLSSVEINKVVILKAGTSRHGKFSALRAKAEGVFQIAAAEKNVEVTLLAPQTLRAQEKKFASIAGGSPEDILNNGEVYKPKPWRDAVLTAWVGLE